MIKKILVLLMVFALASPAYGATVPSHVSGGTVTYSTVTHLFVKTRNMVSFNSATKWIKLINHSTTTDCYVDLDCRDANGKPGYLDRDSATVLVPAAGKQSPNTVEFNYSTRNLGFLSDTGNATGDKITFIVTGDRDL